MNRRRRYPEVVEAEQELDQALLHTLVGILRRGSPDEEDVETLRNISVNTEAALGAQWVARGALVWIGQQPA